ncbi:Serine/threonine-protein phosphatase 2A activator 2, partial [Tilletia horrida]
RFGNPTFRHFYDDVVARSDELHARFFPALREDAERDTPEHRRCKRVARRELKAYFDEAWGNTRRIDYGSGMELNFMCWLLILYKLGIFDDASTYFLEPAGSHGVWGLDDYHFLPFLLGAAQLSDHQYLRPSSIHSVDVLSPPSKYPQEYMYLSQIALLHSIKTIPSAPGMGSAGPVPNSADVLSLPSKYPQEYMYLRSTSRRPPSRRGVETGQLGRAKEYSGRRATRHANA